MISKIARRAGVVASISAIAALGLTVGTVSTSQAAANKVIGVSIADQKSLFYIAAADGMKQAAKAAGYKLVLLSADNDSSKQVNQVQNLLSQKVGAIIYTPQDNTAATAGVKLANKAKVPVVALDQKPESAGAKISTFIATDSVKAAYTVCSWLFKQFNNSGEIAILQGPLGATAEVQRTAGCKKALAENPNVKDVAWQTAGWDETQAFNASQNILTAHPNLKAIFGESDAMALGAAKAAKQAGRSGMVFAGIDGFPTMFTAIQDGLTQGTMAQQPYMMGQLAVKNAIQILQGKGSKIPALQYQDAVLVNKGNVATNNPAKFYGPNATK